MPIFQRREKVTMPAHGASVSVKAAAGSSQVGNFYTYTSGVGADRALRIPAISRAHDLHVSLAGSLALTQYQLVWDSVSEEYRKVYLEGESWFTRPDPKVTRQFIIGQTVSDLIMYGRAFWVITSRYARTGAQAGTGFPASFTWIPAADVETPDQSTYSGQWFGMSNNIEFNGQQLRTADVVQFISPIRGVVYASNRAITIAERLDESAARFAQNEFAAGYLQQKGGGEPMSAEELADLAAGWAQARRANAVGALNEYVEWVSFDQDPSKLQLVESRQFEALEMARIMNVPASMINAPLGAGSSINYTNQQDQRADLYTYGTKIFLDTIQETLSLDNIVPRGRFVEFDVSQFITNPFERYDNESDSYVESPMDVGAPTREDQAIGS